MSAPAPWTAEEHRLAHAVASTGRPYLYLASRLLSDPIKRSAFEVAYASMRLADDAVDEPTTRLAADTAPGLREGVARWIDMVRGARAGRSVPGDRLGAALARLFERFELPLTPWESLAGVLFADIGRQGFDSLEHFLLYAEGAAVGPGVLFALLATAEPLSRDGGRYHPHPAAWDGAWAELARFTYLVHGLRDLAGDLAGGARGTALAPRRELARHGLSPEGLSAAAPAARSAWVKETAARAWAIRRAAGEPWVRPALPAEPAFVLAFLVRLYELQLERIDELAGDVFSGRHRLSAADVLQAAERLAASRPGAPLEWRAILGAELELAPAPRA